MLIDTFVTENPSYQRRYIVRATGVQPLTAYVISAVSAMQLYDCLALCYTVRG